MVREGIQSGRFSVDDLLTEALQALQEKNAVEAKYQTKAAPIEPTAAEPFWKAFTQKVHSLPDEVFERLPENGASEHDHYLYGSKKE